MTFPTRRRVAAERLALALADAAAAARDLADAQDDDPVPSGPVVRPVLLSVAEAGAALGVGRSTIYAMMADGRLPTRRIGNRRLVPTVAVEAIGG